MQWANVNVRLTEEGQCLDPAFCRRPESNLYEELRSEKYEKDEAVNPSNLTKNHGSDSGNSKILDGD